MGSLELLVVAVTIIFFLLRALFRGLRWLFGLGHTATAPSAQAAAEQTRQQILSEAPPPTPIAGVVVPAPSPRTRYPVERSVSPVAQRNSRKAAPQTPVTNTPEKSLLNVEREELMRALIWREILSPPLSRRSRKPPTGT